MTAELRAYTPTLRERLAAGLGGIFGGGRAGHRLGRKAMDVLDLTPVGIATGAYDAGRMMNSPAGIFGGGAMLAAGMIPMARKPVQKGIRAFHGSPHDFDRFDMSKIGTGEGAQAYGHGLYFAEAEDVARQYQKQLSDLRASSVQSEINKAGGDIDVAIKEARRKVDHYQGLKGSLDERRRESLLQINEQKLAQLLSMKEGADISKGRMYEVNIRANPEDFLDWDKPLSGQPAWNRIKQDWDENLGDPDIIMERLGIDENTATGQQYLISVAPQLRGEAFSGVSSKMVEQGIPGIKYLDQGSRAGGEGTRNFVLFRDDIIDVVRKYGIAGAAAMLGLSQGDVAQAMTNERPQ